MYSVAILGASGYAGGELIRFVDNHPHFETFFLGANRRVGDGLGTVHPHLSGRHRVLEAFNADKVAEADLVFMALPHGASGEPAMRLADSDAKIVDLGSDSSEAISGSTPGRGMPRPTVTITLIRASSGVGSMESLRSSGTR